MTNFCTLEVLCSPEPEPITKTTLLIGCFKLGAFLVRYFDFEMFALWKQTIADGADGADELTMLSILTILTLSPCRSFDVKWKSWKSWKRKGRKGQVNPPSLQQCSPPEVPGTCAITLKDLHVFPEVPQDLFQYVQCEICTFNHFRV